MAYTPKVWSTDDPIADTDLNHIEEGIEDVTDGYEGLLATLNALSHVGAYHNTATSIANASGTLIPWANEYYDAKGEHSVGTFTATDTGYYHVSAQVLFAAGTWPVGKIAALLLTVNGVVRCSGPRWISQYWKRAHPGIR